MSDLLNCVEGQAGSAVRALCDDLECLEMSLLPGDIYLAQRPARPDFWIQPDGFLENETVFGFLEVKRIKRGSFQAEQLAREYVAVLQEARRLGKQPLLLLVTPNRPPLPIKGRGLQPVADAIAWALKKVLPRCAENFGSVEGLVARVGRR
jgi:hypothetical protein